ncbi:MAG: N-acetylmuramoyl-L-alanine amidase [Alphaproteobacteria bacterium]|jgi:N-acetylmuramoyl-L-alanine amidase
MTRFLIILSIIFYAHLAFALKALDADIGVKNKATIFYLRLSDKPSKVKKFMLSKPDRVVLDIEDLDWKIQSKVTSKGIIKKIRFGKSKNFGRIVLDLHSKVKENTLSVVPHPSKLGLFLLKLTLTNNYSTSPIKTIKNPTIKKPNIKKPNIKKPSQSSAAKKQKFYSKHKFKTIKRRHPNEIIITIDAGHGGNDPGASSVSGYKEKNIVLAFAKEFANAVNRQRNMRAILTREKDFFIPLAERPLIATHYQSDLFISVHADALEDKNFSGSTVYTLSDTASDAIAAQLAESENRSDVIAGVDFDNQLPEVTDILIDFMRRETDIASYEFAENLVQKLKKSTKLVPSPHRKAGFRVLKSPDIPSVLIELGYLTSITDERRLTNPQKRRKMITSMIDAIKNWHYQRRLSGY